MHNIYNFIKWALTHADPKTIVKSGSYPLPSEEIGVDPVHYLFGTVWTQTTKQALDWKYIDYYGTTKYSNPPMTREEYDRITGNWKPTDHATDCQGLLDAWFRLEGGDPTMDINADMNYKYWCKDKGKIKEISRDFVIGEAVFMQSSSSGKMTHVGWVCGFTDSGEPLVVEARGIKYGVVITRLNARNWTHRGLMLEKFIYAEPKPTTIGILFEVPIDALNAVSVMDDLGNRYVLRLEAKRSNECGVIKLL